MEVKQKLQNCGFVINTPSGVQGRTDGWGGNVLPEGSGNGLPFLSRGHSRTTSASYSLHPCSRRPPKVVTLAPNTIINLTRKRDKNTCPYRKLFLLVKRRFIRPNKKEVDLVIPSPKQRVN